MVKCGPKSKSEEITSTLLILMWDLSAVYQQVAVVVTEPDSEGVEISIQPTEPQVEPEGGKAEPWLKPCNVTHSVMSCLSKW